MKPTWFAALALVLFVAPPARADEPAPVQVMILGTYHLDNPGQDLHNVKVDDVTTPRRQAELAELARRLQRFKPTRIAVEAAVDTADLVYTPYRAFTPAALTKQRDERIQIGFRVAHNVKLAEVHGIDERSKTVDYFPFDKVKAYADRRGGAFATRLAALMKQGEAITNELAAALKTQSTGAILARMNEPARLRADHAFYYDLLALGDSKAQPGAELNAAWYLRNAKIFAKLIQIARPGDRVIVVFGAGHAYWLRHFVETTRGFQLVEPNRYLTDAGN
jgi:hypothetical protein